MRQRSHPGPLQMKAAVFAPQKSPHSPGGLAWNLMLKTRKSDLVLGH